jgi:hypothetical protein
MEIAPKQDLERREGFGLLNMSVDPQRNGAIQRSLADYETAVPHRRFSFSAGRSAAFV